MVYRPQIGMQRSLASSGTRNPLRLSRNSAKLFRLNLRSFFSSSTRSDSEPDFEAARKWYQSLNGPPLAKEIGDVSYSRSSGPGGQNVNKVNSKAQLRVPLDQLLPLLPTVLHEGIRSSRYHADRTATLLIQSDESRKQAANKDTCYRRLNELVLDVYKHTVPGETTSEQKKKVRDLQRLENESRIKSKKHLSSKKASRRGDE